MDMVERVLRAHPAQFGKILENVAGYKFQVLVSEVSEDQTGCPCLVRHGFRVDHEYFYPASAIKICAAVAALQKLKHLTRALGMTVSCCTPLSFYPLLEEAREERADASNLNSQNITIAHEIRKLFLISDNEAFNRLYDFVGHRSLNQAMWDLNLRSTRLQQHLSEVPSSSGRENLICRPIDVNVGGHTAATIPPKWSQLLTPDNSSLRGVKVGNAYITPDKDLVNDPMDFSRKNCISLLDLQNLLIKITRTDIELDSAPLKLDEGLRMLLMEAMVQYPADSCNPRYDRTDYPDDYCKFFLPGLCRVRTKGAIRVYNKVGRAYGFTIDNAYIFDTETGRSFFLSATIYTNANGVLNDDRYAYEDIADRVMADLAEVIARAVWQIPPALASLSTPFDCIPSSLWNACGRPVLQQQQQPDALEDQTATTIDSLVDPFASVTLSATSGLAGADQQQFCYFIDE